MKRRTADEARVLTKKVREDIITRKKNEMREQIVSAYNRCQELVLEAIQLEKYEVIVGSWILACEDELLEDGYALVRRWKECRDCGDSFCDECSTKGYKVTWRKENDQNYHLEDYFDFNSCEPCRDLFESRAFFKYMNIAVQSSTLHNFFGLDLLKDYPLDEREPEANLFIDCTRSLVVVFFIICDVDGKSTFWKRHGMKISLFGTQKPIILNDEDCFKWIGERPSEWQPLTLKRYIVDEDD